MLGDSGCEYDRFYREAFPRQMVDLGIAEQHAVSFAAGMAADGWMPFLEPVSYTHLDVYKRQFAMFVANWEDKAGNIRKIQQTLNIGMDSMIFLDDNPFERNVVRGLIPEITVPELPEDPALYLSYLQSLNLFETVSFSVADLSRTQQYQEEGQRTQTAAQFASYDEYLQSLEMAAHVAPFDAFHTPRIAQLTQRSNQFNLRTRRYTEADVELSLIHI